jgi:hypothetical protein
MGSRSSSPTGGSGAKAISLEDQAQERSFALTEIRAQTVLVQRVVRVVQR